jgi:hypothetical protein
VRSRLVPVVILAVVVAIAAVLIWGSGELREPTPIGSPLPSGSAPVGSPVGSPFGAAASGGQPAFGRVYLVVFENHGFDAVVNGSEMPYLKGLIKQGALATAYSAITHPSQPNYIALFSGDLHGITDDGNHNLTAPNLADQLEARGKTWAVSAENLPEGCFRGASASGGADGPGTYARKHEPAISFLSISRNPARCARITNLSSFDPSRADFQLIVPNLCHDAHDCSLAVADKWLAVFAPKILDSAAFKSNGVLFVTFDEAQKGVPNSVALVAVGPSVRVGTTTTQAGNHYSLLRTIEDNWSLGCLARACSTEPLRTLFMAGPAVVMPHQ